MKTAVIFNSDLYFEHKLWKRELFFWEDELKSFKKRLTELIERWEEKDLLAQLEHYQNQFLIHENKINELQDDIDIHEISISESSKKGTELLNMSLLKKHIECRNHIETQRHIYSDLKKEFFRFLSKYL